MPAFNFWALPASAAGMQTSIRGAANRLKFANSSGIRTGSNQARVPPEQLFSPVRPGKRPRSPSVGQFVLLRLSLVFDRDFRDTRKGGRLQRPLKGEGQHLVHGLNKVNDKAGKNLRRNL